MNHPYETMKMMASTTTTGGLKSVRIYGKREEELQATRESLERDLKELAEAGWVQFTKRSYLRLSIKYKTKHLLDTLKNYKEGQTIR